MKTIKSTLCLFLCIISLFCMSVGASAATVEDATIDMDRTGSFNIYKYDLTNAEKDGVWDSSYVSTGVKDSSGVEAVLGNSNRVSDLGNGEQAYGYALKGVEFTYLKVANIRTYTESENGESHVEVLYGIPANTTTDQFLNAIGVAHSNRYEPADQVVDGAAVYYYQSDVLIDNLADVLASNSTTVKNALEAYVTANGGTALPETDAYGHTSASGLPLGLYLIMETRVPEMVTSTTAPFFVSLPMTSVDGSNASDGGTRWMYDVTLYPKNLTGIPSLEKTVRESAADTGHNDGSVSDINDGYAHTATASAADVVEYQIISTLPSITSEATWLTCYTFEDVISKGISYNKNDVVLEFFTDEGCTNKISTWKQSDSVAKFTVNYSTNTDGDPVMTIAMTAEGLREINANKLVYTGSDMVNSGYSDCTVRITYAATVNSNDTVTYGDDGNTNEVTLTWKRTNTDYYDVLSDDCHVYVYGIDLTKQFSDGKGNFENVEFVVFNDSDLFFVEAQLLDDGVYYVTDHVEAEEDATHFIPTDEGKIVIKGLENDSYTLTETRTDNGYTLLKDNIEIVIKSEASDTLCDCYDDTLGVVQNDGRYTHIQKHLEHYLLTASATVDGNDVDMDEDKGSVNALAPLTVVNTRGFDLPQTGSNGTWMFPVIGGAFMILAAVVIFLLRKKKF